MHGIQQSQSKHPEPQGLVYGMDITCGISSMLQTMGCNIYTHLWLLAASTKVIFLM